MGWLLGLIIELNKILRFTWFLLTSDQLRAPINNPIKCQADFISNKVYKSCI